MSRSIRVTDSSFANARSAQQRGIDRLFDLSDRQDAILNRLADSWTGTGRPDYNQAIREVRRQTLTGIFMLRTLSNQTNRTRLRFREADQSLANTTRILPK